MIDSDFTIGFKQGQEHGIQIMQEKIEDIKQEIIDNSIIETTENGLKKISYVSVDYVLSVIDNHIGEEKEGETKLYFMAD